MRITPILALLAGAVTATDFYITSPHSTVTWKAGEQTKITWNILPGGGDVKSISVDLMDGDDKNAHVLMPIASGLASDATSVDWTVPANFQASNTVFVRVQGQTASNPVHRYSHRFAVQDASGAAAPQQSNPPVKAQDAAQTTAKAQASVTAAATRATSGTTDNILSDIFSQTDTLTDTTFTLSTPRTSALNAASSTRETSVGRSALCIVGAMIALLYLA